MIQVTELMRKEKPISAEWFDFINDALKINPNMSLSGVAYIIDQDNKQDAMRRLIEAEKAQLKEIGICLHTELNENCF